MSIGTGKQTSQTELPGDLKNIITDAYGKISPLTDVYINQLMEAATTGGVGARVPIIQRAQEAQRTAYSTALDDLSKQLAQQGLSGTPFAAEQIGSLTTKGRSAIADVGPNIVNQMLGVLPNFLTGNQSAVLGSLASGRTTDAKGYNWNFEL